MQVGRPGGMGFEWGSCGHGRRLRRLLAALACCCFRPVRPRRSIHRARCRAGSASKWTRRRRVPSPAAGTSPSPPRSRLPAPRASCSRSAGSSSPARPSTAMRIRARSTPTWSAREVPLAAVYELARRITAKYGAAGYVLSRAVVPPQNFGRHGAVVPHPGGRGLCRQGRCGRWRSWRATGTSSPTTTARIVADRPANIRTLERYLLLANDLPGLKFSTTLKPSPTNPNASTLIVEVKEKPIDAVARIDNRGTIARGPWQYLGSATLNNTRAARTRRSRVTYAGTFQVEELQYLAAGYRQVLNSEGLTPSSTRATASAGRAPSCSRARLSHARRVVRGRPELSVDPHAREESHRDRASASSTNDDSFVLGA